MTADQFMDWDGGGHVGKLELVNGEVRAMSPASSVHGLIQANLAYLIGRHLRENKLPCRVATEAPVQPQLHANDNVRAPDLAVTCAPPAKSKVFHHPVLIIEILITSNRKETWESIHTMASISTLKEIAVVESEKMHVEVFRRGDDGAWPKDGEVSDMGGTVRLTSIGAEFLVSEIYEGTHLA
jgi:Uma2 family endonuclease